MTVPDRGVPPLAIRLFGPVEVRVAGCPLPRLHSRKSLWLLALLTLRGGRDVERAWLAALLWPDSSPSQSLANLRISLNDLRHALGSEADRLRSPTTQTLCLDLTGAEADVVTFDRAVVRGDPASLEEAVTLYRGALLEGCAEEWVLQEREPREQSYLTALERLAAGALERGETEAAERHLRRAVAVDPVRESAQRALMQALAAGGNYAAALLAYRELRLCLQREIGAEPGATTRALFEQIRAEGRRFAKGQGSRVKGQRLRVEGQGSRVAPVETRDPRPLTLDPRFPRPAALGQVVLLHQHNAEPDGRVLAFLEAQLAAAGYAVFVDRRPMIGVEWAQEIERQVRTADAVILLLSPASVHSEMLAYEVEMAHAAQRALDGRPHLVPIRVRYTGPLPEPLASLLNPLGSLLWEGPADDQRVAAALLDALRRPVTPSPLRPLTPSPPTLPLEQALLGGAVPLDSEFYVVRPTDGLVHAAIARQDSLVLVKGARQMGKTSLLGRGLHQARQAGAKTVLTDFQTLNAAHLESADALLLTLAEWFADQLELDISPEVAWNPRRGASMNFEWYLRREVLGKTSAPLVWGLDEVDRLFTCDFGSEVFGLFRSWHNRRLFEPDGPWSRLTLAIAYATEAHLFITDLNQSPFNVGTRLTLEDLTLDQVADLNDRYGCPLQNDAEVARFYDLVSGQPYLVSRGLAEMAAHGIGIDALEAQADRDEGLFGDHLRRLLVSLARDPELCDVVRGVLQGQPCPTPESFYRLRSAGVITGESARDARIRCRLYATYLGCYLGRSVP